jgi:TetR/AcrR family tetracycline transcriptional repressor
MACTPYSCQEMKTSPQPDDGERERLSKAAVLDRAMALVDAEGLDALSIRKLAQSLGVTPMAMYWHFKSKEDLLAGLAGRIWAEMDLNVDQESRWPDQLRTLLESLVSVLRAHPAAPDLLLHDQKQNEASLRAMEITLELLNSAGFDTQQAAGIARSALYTGITLVKSQPGPGPGMSEEEFAERQRRDMVRLALLPVEKFPYVVKSAKDLTACDDPELHYRQGIDLFIAGIEATAPPHTEGRGPKT